jgi:hypothetical protein
MPNPAATAVQPCGTKAAYQRQLHPDTVLAGAEAEANFDGGVDDSADGGESGGEAGTGAEP